MQGKTCARMRDRQMRRMPTQVQHEKGICAAIDDAGFAQPKQKGPHFVVVLNGQKTVDAQDSRLADGHIALQYRAGVVKFRKVQIKPL